ncbi:MAG: hypothetical protein ACAH80_16160 [Alphaproteobacteria bacterium]
MVKYRTAAELPVDLKQVKEDILSTAWQEQPSAEKVAKFEMMDMNIQHYLLMQFNNGRGILRASSEDTLFLLQCDATPRDRPSAEISQEQIKTIMHNHVSKARALNPGA